MVSQHERNHLVNLHKDRFVDALAPIVKCATGLIIVLALALFGVAMDLNQENGAGLQARR